MLRPWSSIATTCAWTKTLHGSTGKLTGIVSIAPTPLSVRICCVPQPRTAIPLRRSSTWAVPLASRRPSPMTTLRRPQRLVASARGESKAAWMARPRYRHFSFRCHGGTRWLFDLRAIEHGSSMEARMLCSMTRASGSISTTIAATSTKIPLIEHTFADVRDLPVKLDQYRGPRGFNFGKNCAYMLRVSALPVIAYSAPWGMRRGRTTRLRVGGSGLESVERVYITQLRQSEYSRSTYPFRLRRSFSAPTHLRHLRLHDWTGR